MKTILITGINGFLGSSLAKTLKKEYNIIGLEYSLDDLFRIANEDFLIYSSEDDYEEIFKSNNIFCVIHAATFYRRNSDPIKPLINTNILLPVRLYELSNIYNVKLFLNTDSFFNNSKYNYSYLPDYTLSKKHAIEWLISMKGACKIVNMKIFHMFGPKDASNKFVPQILEQFNKNVSEIDTTDGEQTRDFIYINDIVEAYRTVLSSDNQLISSFSEFQIGTGKQTSIKEFLTLAKEVTSSTTKIYFGKLPYRENEIMSSKADIQSLLDLGWTPKYSLLQGLREYFESL